MNRVLIEPIESDSTSGGGIFIPEKARPDMNRGKVISLGSGRRMDGTIQDFEVKIGDTVVFKLGAAQVTVAGEVYFLVQEEDIIAVL